jgi:predicted Zn-dependent protease
LSPERWAKAEEEGVVSDSLRLLHAQATGDLPMQVEELGNAVAKMAKWSADPARSAAARSDYRALEQDLRSRLAMALTRAGSWRDAALIIAPVPNDHDAALRARGLVQAYAGNHAMSDKLLADAVARTPSLPAAHLVWAEALLLRKEARRAVEQLTMASRKGPRSAEVMRLWGDALMAAGDVRGAERRYALAAERAPRWGQLHLLWAHANWRLGKRGTAVDKLKAASTMDLSEADRRLLTTMARNAGRGRTGQPATRGS